MTNTSNKDATIPPLSTLEATARPADAACTVVRGTERQNIAGMWLSASSANAQKEDTTGGSISPIRDPGLGTSAVGAALWLKIIALSRMSSSARTSAPPATTRGNIHTTPSAVMMIFSGMIKILATILLAVLRKCEQSQG